MIDITQGEGMRLYALPLVQIWMHDPQHIAVNTAVEARAKYIV